LAAINLRVDESSQNVVDKSRIKWGLRSLVDAIKENNKDGVVLFLKIVPKQSLAEELVAPYGSSSGHVIRKRRRRSGDNTAGNGFVMLHFHQWLR
jgi:hypothetical protein